MRIISSDIALKAAAALSAAAELTLGDLARAVGATPSAMQRGLAILLQDRIVERREGRARSTYRLASNERACHVAALAIEAIPLAGATAIGARAARAVEFVARRDDVLVVVFTAGSPALDQARAARFLEALARRHGLRVEYLDHDDVRRQLLADPHLRSRMARSRVLHGRLERSFPDRSRHGLRQGRPLHRPHPALRLPSASTLRRIARRYGVRRLRLFGSAVRSDLRRDSDIDVLMRFGEGVRPTLRSLLDLELALERVFGRDVDLLREETLDPEVRARIDREAVPLL